MFANVMSTFKKGGLAGKLGGAVVINNNDPTKNQRVKYRMATLHKDQGDDEMVWAIPLGWGAQGNSAAGVGSISVPPVGAKIIIFFPEDDPHDSYYIADYHDQTTQVAELLEDYPNSYGHVDASGNLLLINTMQNTVRFMHISGSYIKFNADGSGELAFAQGFTVFATGPISFRSMIALNLDAPTININDGVSPALVTNPRSRPTAGNFSNLSDL